MYGGKKTARRGNAISQGRGQNTVRSRPLTRKQSALLLSEEVQNDTYSEQYVLVALTLTKKLLIVEFRELAKSNEQAKIKIGSKVFVKADGEQLKQASVFCIGSKKQCSNEAKIIKDQRGSKEYSNSPENSDNDDSLSVMKVSVGSVQKNTSPSESNILPSSSTSVSLSSSSSVGAEPTLGLSIKSVNSLSTTLTVPSSTTTTNNAAATHNSSSTNTYTTQPNLQSSTTDPLSELMLQMNSTTKDRDKWKQKFLALEQRYIELENASMMIPIDDNVCEWIRTLYDAIQRQNKADVDFNVESKKLGISPGLLEYCIHRSKPPTTTARKIFQYVCQNELATNTSWSNIPASKIEAIHVFGEKLFGRLKWDRKNIKISLQNFIRGERLNVKRDQCTNYANSRNGDDDALVDNELVIEDIQQP